MTPLLYSWLFVMFFLEIRLRCKLKHLAPWLEIYVLFDYQRWCQIKTKDEVSDLLGFCSLGRGEIKTGEICFVFGPSGQGRGRIEIEEICVLLTPHGQRSSWNLIIPSPKLSFWINARSFRDVTVFSSKVEANLVRCLQNKKFYTISSSYFRSRSKSFVEKWWNTHDLPSMM